VNVLSAPSPATIYGAGTQNIDTISILATGATYTGVSRNTSFLRSSVLGWILTDQPGILTVEQSTDNTNWRKILVLNVVAKADPTPYETKLYAQYYRLKFTNTGTAAQTVMQLISNTYNNSVSNLIGLFDQTSGILASIKAANARSQSSDTAIVVERRDIPAIITAIATDGTSGDKTILVPNSGKSLRISSLYFISATATSITFKSGSTAISGAMNLSSHAADYTNPIAITTGQNFVINIGSPVAIRGYVVWWEV
ncbi:hypothetical protein LC605_24140, partial [Nostoc sp. CHAB 5836]|uniref:hypothetical protein n=1 Tax=Nostoc sp. CHAB 5836 TaxID=2780404 RepID=UPI001E4D1513